MQQRCPVKNSRWIKTSCFHADEFRIMRSNPRIQSIGTAVPPYRISQDKHYAILESANGLSRAERLTMRRIYSKSGISWRYSILDEFDEQDHADHEVFHPAGELVTPVADRMTLFEKHAPGLCTDAAKACLKKLPLLKRNEITHIICFSCTGMYAPGLDIQLVEVLGLQRSTERTCINFMGCYAAINALKAAYHICRSEPEAVVLIAGAELCSLHYQKSAETNQMIANALFGDGAAAAIISCRDLGNDAESLSLHTFYSEFEPAGLQDMVWRIGNAGFDLRLTPEVPEAIRANIGELTGKLLKKAAISRAEVSHYAIHPGGTRILEACEQAMDLDQDATAISREVLDSYGNMSSVTILFVLEKLMRKVAESSKPEWVMACAFGPGLTMESVIMQTAGNAKS
ncbi:MAG: type III polyketide synthase [Sphingobacteriales bacterium]|nr:MAG: type III polyketide synthase [Sphingobacteriales bacterium]